MKTNNKCLSCGTQMKEKLETVKHDEGGLGITLTGVPVYRCPKCGDYEVAIRNLEGLHQEIAHALARRRERLQAEEIRFMRKYLGMSVPDLAKRLRTGVDTVKHWEASGKPRPIGVQAEMLLRMMVVLNHVIEGYGLGEMATSDAKPGMLEAAVADGSWRVRAA